MQEANTTQHFNSISTVGLSVLEGVPEVKGAVDQGCGFKGEETKFWKGCGSGIKDGLSLVSISTAETMIQDPIQHMQKAFGSKKGLRRNPCISKGARTLKQLGTASADRVVADPAKPSRAFAHLTVHILLYLLAFGSRSRLLRVLKCQNYSHSLAPRKRLWFCCDSLRDGALGRPAAPGERGNAVVWLKDDLMWVFIFISTHLHTK